MPEREVNVTTKDDKEEIICHLINLSKSSIGKFSKSIFHKVNQQIHLITKVN